MPEDFQNIEEDFPRIQFRITAGTAQFLKKKFGIGSILNELNLSDIARLLMLNLASDLQRNDNTLTSLRLSGIEKALEIKNENPNAINKKT